MVRFRITLCALVLASLAGCSLVSNAPSQKKVAMAATTSTAAILKTAGIYASSSLASQDDIEVIAFYSQQVTDNVSIVNRLAQGKSVCVGGDTPGEVCTTLNDCEGLAQMCYKGPPDAFNTAAATALNILGQFKVEGE